MKFNDEIEMQMQTTVNMPINAKVVLLVDII